jgi:hypothetical protein
LPAKPTAGQPSFAEVSQIRLLFDALYATPDKSRKRRIRQIVISIDLAPDQRVLAIYGYA